MKILIIGNAGCGKTYISKKIATRKKIPLYHIDEICFKPGGYGKEFVRTQPERMKIINNIKTKKNYIIEGACGLIANQFASYATHIIMIAYEKKVCIKSIKTRKLPKGQKSTKKQTAWLVNMAKEYYDEKNKGSISYNAHKHIFDNFNGTKFYIVNRSDANTIRL